MNVLLSIKPKYVEAIMDGKKKYEFRKIIFRNRDINTVYIYSSSPVKRIVASFTLGGIIEGSPKKLWELLNPHSGLTYNEFQGYFGDARHGFALEIEDLREFKEAINPIDVFPDFVPPQSFCYLGKEI